SQGLPFNKQNWKDTNLASDIEVNTTLVNKHVISAESLVKDIKGLYLSKKNGDRTNLPMESILEDEKLMNKLREMVNGKKDTRPHVQTSTEWDDGYKEGWDKIADLLDKYGAEELFKKLQDAGIINKKGQLINDDKDEILNLNFINIKSPAQFIFESKEKENENENMFKSFDDGFKTGIAKAITMIAQSLGVGGDSDGQGGQGGMQPQNNNPVPNSKLKPEDLKKLNLPKKEDNNDGKGGGMSDNLPTNTSNDDPQAKGQVSPQTDKKDGGQNNNQEGNESGNSNGEGNGESSDGKDSGDDNQKGESGQGGDGENTDDGNQSSSSSGKGGNSKESGSGDINKLADDLKNKSNKSSNGGGDAGYANKPIGKGGDEQQGIGDTGSFINDPDSSFAKDVLKNSGYSEEDIKNILRDTIEKNKRLNSPEGIQEKRNKLRSKLSGSDPVKKYLDEIEVSEAKYKNIWKKILKQFLGVSNRHAGKDKRSSNFDWKNKRSIAMGRLSPNFHKEKNEPQNINLYIDVSGSVNVELLEVIAKSLCILCEQYEYSGINIIPWASTSNGVHKVESIKNTSKEQVAKEILGYISQGVDECGGGTDLIGAFLPELIDISNNKDRRNKDDKNIIITDGETGGDEKRIEQLISKESSPLVAKNCFWMIYDSSEYVKKSWEESISKGTLIFINSQTVIGNK
ncbi:MAG: hypothetical protein K2I67_02785, partial [Malacoplasma sp.]|nr:hypothetical protein [Malacoplasma sp.]